MMNRSAKGGTGRACTMEAKAFSFTHPHQGVCGRHGTEEQRVTSGELAESSGGTGVSRPISESEVASQAVLERIRMLPGVTDAGRGELHDSERVGSSYDR
jgi:hypothetical protein